MPIPTTRAELLDQIRTSFAKLRAELEAAGPRAGSLSCADAWSVKDLIAVRVWWTERVVEWIEAGRRGEMPVTPAPGYRWNETPRLNDAVVAAAGRESYRALLRRLERGYRRVLRTIDALDDRALLEVGVFPWAGRYPVARWLSINTARQYTSARALVRRALRQATD